MSVSFAYMHIYSKNVDFYTHSFIVNERATVRTDPSGILLEPYRIKLITEQ